MLPSSLEAATERMLKPNSIAREVFGHAFVDHFGGTREHEVSVWNKAVTDWEGEYIESKLWTVNSVHIVARYFELV